MFSKLLSLVALLSLGYGFAHLPILWGWLPYLFLSLALVFILQGIVRYMRKDVE